MTEPYIIAIDFDGTLWLDGWPDTYKGHANHDILIKMRDQLNKNPKTEFILWTCRAGKYLDEAIDVCLSVLHLPIAYFNEHHPSTYDWWDGELPIKIFAHEYWDDRAVRIA